MGNTIFIQEKRVRIKPLCSRLEAKQKLELPTTVKGCRSSGGMVNFLRIFCQDLQKLLKPIYDLTRKAHHYLVTRTAGTIQENQGKVTKTTHFTLTR